MSLGLLGTGRTREVGGVGRWKAVGVSGPRVSCFGEMKGVAVRYLGQRGETREGKGYILG